MLAVLIGAALGLSGAALQGLLRNPLAEPSIFAAPQGASLAAVCVLYFGWAGLFSVVLPLAAILGACLALLMVLVIAGRRANLLVLILAGLAVGTLAGAGTSLALSLSPNPYAVTEIVFWLMGSLEDRSFVHVWLCAPFIVAGGALVLLAKPALTALVLGEDVAQTLGFSIAHVRLVIIAGTAIMTGAGVAVAGSIGFIGLIAPHLARPLFGHDPGRLLVPSALIGAILLVLADIGVRIISSGTEIRIGAVTALLGVPLFLWIIARDRRML